MTNELIDFRDVVRKAWAVLVLDSEENGFDGIDDEDEILINTQKRLLEALDGILMRRIDKLDAVEDTEDSFEDGPDPDIDDQIRAAVSATNALLESRGYVITRVQVDRC